MEQADLAKYEAYERDKLITHFADHLFFPLAGEISALLKLLIESYLILSKLLFIAVTPKVLKSYNLPVAVFQA